MAICVIGVAQEITRPPGPAPEPLESWTRLARVAADDAGTSGVLSRLDAVHVVFCQSWPYDDPAGRLSQRLGIYAAETHYSGIGGTAPQELINDIAQRMLRGELGLALITGAEALATVRTARQEGRNLAWSHRTPVDKPFPYEGLPSHAEVAHEVHHAWETFALWDTARRARLGTSLADYERAIGSMMAPMTEVAATNPYAWRPTVRTAAELATPSATNRYIGWPHTRNEVAVMDVDLAAAVILATDEVADELGVDPGRRIYLSGWAYATDPVSVAAREDMSRSTAMSVCSSQALSMANTSVDELGAFDLYSCFPSALNFACDALKIDPMDPRGLTVTGGLPFAGGPSSNYMLHSVAAMISELRRSGGTGLVTGIGMHMTKHISAVYSAIRPPSTVPGDPAAVQSLTDEQPLRPLLGAVNGLGSVVAYTAAFDRENRPTRGLVVADLPEGRALARVNDPALVADMCSRELVGQSVQLVANGEVNRVEW